MGNTLKDKRKILCFGEILWDKLPDQSIPGGAPMNVAFHLVHHGNDVDMVSCVGSDEDGRKLIDFVEKNGLQTDLIQIDKRLKTSEVLVKLNVENNATYKIVELVAWDQMELTPTLKAAAENAEIIIYGSLAARNEKTRNTILSILNDRNIKLMDINLRPPYNQQKIVE